MTNIIIIKHFWCHLKIKQKSPYIPTTFYSLKVLHTRAVFFGVFFTVNFHWIFTVYFFKKWRLAPYGTGSESWQDPLQNISSQNPVRIQSKFQFEIPGNKKDIKKFQITFLKKYGWRLRTLTGLALSPHRIHFKTFF
jgi:hypothetical protein